MPICAKLVFDGGDVMIPDEMGTPRSDQLQGTPAERLCELAGRVCYDSLGKGRSSQEYHKHILEVGHTSTLEHFNFTVRFFNADYESKIAICCLNRKGVHFKYNRENVEITANLRSVLEWDRYSTGRNSSISEDYVAQAMKLLAYTLAPNIVKGLAEYPRGIKLNQDSLDVDQSFVSMFLSGSRGFSHEMVRHRYAMSQRSTRYVDESESEWIEHPLITDWYDDDTRHMPNSSPYQENCSNPNLVLTDLGATKRKCQTSYNILVADLEAYLTAKGIDKFSARKQARGAARGYLGNALETQMIFTAPVSGWRDMIRQRCSRFADAEIRLIFNQVVTECKRSRCAHFFENMNLVPSPDGIGMILEEKP